MFEDLPEYQLEQLTKVWEATSKAMYWRGRSLYEMGRALAMGCTPEHLAAVTGFDVETFKRLLRRPRQEFKGRHPTNRHAPGLRTADGQRPPTVEHVGEPGAQDRWLGVSDVDAANRGASWGSTRLASTGNRIVN
jgi:hypothetical protein